MAEITKEKLDKMIERVQQNRTLRDIRARDLRLRKGK